MCPENEPAPEGSRFKRLEARVDKLEAEMALAGKALVRAAEEIETEWDEQILPEGTEIRGNKF